MITIPTWLFVLLIVLAAPIAVALALITLVILCIPLFALKAAAKTDRQMEEALAKKEREEKKNDSIN